MAAGRVTQNVKEVVSGAATTPKARVTQAVKEVSVSGGSATGKARVTQVVKEVSVRGGSATGKARVTQVVKEVLVLYHDIALVGTTTVGSNSVLSGGVVAKVSPSIPITGTVVAGAGMSVNTGGVIRQGIPITGAAAFGASTVYTGGTAKVGLFTITLPPTSLLGYSGLGAIQLGEVNETGLPPLTIWGSPSVYASLAGYGRPNANLPVQTPSDVGKVLLGGYTITGASPVPGPSQPSPSGGSINLILGIIVAGNVVTGASSVKTPGLMDTGIPITGTVTTGAGSSVLAGGVIGEGIPITGTVTAGAGPSVLTGGTIVLFTVMITGTTTVVSVSTVFPGGLIKQGIPIVGINPFWSSSVLTGGSVSGQIGFVHPQLEGHGAKAMLVPRPNRHDHDLEGYAAMYARAMSAVIAGDRGGQGWGVEGLQGLQGLGYMPYSPSPSQAPFHHYLRPDQRRNFFERGVITTPTTISGDNVVLTFTVPTGYFGVLLGIFTVYTGTGFVQGSGDIIWRVRVANHWVKDMASMPYSLGDLSNPMPLNAAYSLQSGQSVQMLVNVPNISGLIQIGASNILVGAQGWYYPMPSPTPVQCDNDRWR